MAQFSAKLSLGMIAQCYFFMQKCRASKSKFFQMETLYDISIEHVNF